MRASFPKQSWPAAPRHRRLLLTLPCPASSPAVTPGREADRLLLQAAPGDETPEISGATREGQRWLPGITHCLHQQIVAFSVPTGLIPSRPAYPHSERGGTPSKNCSAPGLSRGNPPFHATIASCLSTALTRDLAQRGRPPVAKGLPGHSPRSGTGVPRGHRVPGAAAAPPHHQTAAAAAGRTANS